MISAVPDILSRIVEHKKAELADAVPSLPERTANRRDFAAALRARTPAIIAEIKKASPSKGLLAPAFDPPGTASQYESGGAAAISVLTDKRFFQGSLEDLGAARAATSIPVLRKDFTISPWQVVEAWSHGADAILLIAAILSELQMRSLRELAAQHGMAALVEVHNARELDAAAGSGAGIIGVNNRDLHTFEVRLETSLELADRIPSDAIRVSESGIHSRKDVVRLQAEGYSAFLVGEHLMRSGDPARAVQDLLA